MLIRIKRCRRYEHEFKMGIKRKSTGELVATVEGDDWKRAQKKAFNKIKKNITCRDSARARLRRR